MKCHLPTPQVIRRVACASIVATIAVAMTANVVKAAELNPAHVPMDAKWLLHIDQEALSDLEVAEAVREMYPNITDNIREWFEDRYGIDPQEDCRSLTIFSRDYQAHTGTVLLQTEYDARDIRSMLNKYDSLEKTQWKGYTLYTITLAKHHHDDAHATNHALEGGKEMTVYLGDELIVLASSVPNAKSVLRLLEGDAQSLKETDSPLIAKAPKGAMIYGAAIELGRLDQYHMLLPLLQQQEQCVYAFGQRDGKLFETLTLTAQSEQIAKKSTEVLEGMIAYERLCAAGSEPLTKLMNNVQITHDKMESKLTWEGDSELVVKAVRDFGKRVGHWMRVLDMPRWHSDKEVSHEGDSNAQERPRERRLARRAWLGAMIRTAAEADADVEIARIYVDSPADKAGLKPGDRITQIDGKDVSSPETVTKCIGRLEPGTKVDIVVKRDGEKMTVDVEVGNLEDLHERLFGERFRQKFDDFHEMFDPDFDGIPEGVFSFRNSSGEDEDLTLRELLREMRGELRQFRQELQDSNGGGRDSSTEQETEGEKQS